MSDRIFVGAGSPRTRLENEYLGEPALTDFAFDRTLGLKFGRSHFIHLILVREIESILNADDRRDFTSTTTF